MANFIIMIILYMVIMWVVTDKGKSFNGKCESPIEWRLYNALKNRGYDVKCQYPCGKFRIDLALPQYRIAIECDGKAYHSSPEQKKYDKRRTSYLRRHGWKSVIRFSGSEINRNPHACVSKIEKKIGRLYG